MQYLRNQRGTLRIGRSSPVQYRLSVANPERVLHFPSGTVQFNTTGIPKNRLVPLEEVAKLCAVA